MSNIYGLSHLPEYDDIVSYGKKVEKTTIKKGVIHRDHIWVDAGGRELIPLSQGKFKRKEPWPVKKSQDDNFFFDLKIIPRKTAEHQLEPKDEWVDDEAFETLLLVVFVLSICASFFFLGYAVGMRKGSVLQDQEKVTGSVFNTSMSLASRKPLPLNEFTKVSMQN